VNSQINNLDNLDNKTALFDGQDSIFYVNLDQKIISEFETKKKIKLDKKKFEKNILVLNLKL